MKVQVEIQLPNKDFDIKNLSCDAGQISRSWQDIDGKTWLLIDVDPSAQSKIKDILFNRPVSMGCCHMNDDCTYCSRED